MFGIGFNSDSDIVSEIKRGNEKALVTLYKQNLGAIKKFVLLPDEFSQERNEITPTLKLKRKVINQTYKDSIESMYDAELSHSN